MSRFRTWLISDKKFFNYFRAFSRKLPNHCRSCLFSTEFIAINYSSYLSYLFFQRKFTKCAEPHFLVKNPENLRVPPAGGTLSLCGWGNASRCGNNPSGWPAGLASSGWQYAPKKEEKIVWLFEIDKIPSRHREGLVKLLNKHRANNFLCSIFSPRSFSYALAGESDLYLIRKKSWLPVLRQLNSIFLRIYSRSSVLPNFPQKMTLREKLVIRILYRFRHGFASLDDISSYLYGRRLAKNMRCSEAAIADVRQKLVRITGRKNVINNVRRYGYRIDERMWEKILSDERTK